MNLLSKQEASSKENRNEALQLFVSILQLNYQILSLDDDQKDEVQLINTQITTESFKLARLEDSIAEDSKIIDSICEKLDKISQEIEVCSCPDNIVARRFVWGRSEEC
jgi:hypothetical protein